MNDDDKSQFEVLVGATIAAAKLSDPGQAELWLRMYLETAWLRGRLAGIEAARALLTKEVAR